MVFFSSWSDSWCWIRNCSRTLGMQMDLKTKIHNFNRQTEYHRCLTAFWGKYIHKKKKTTMNFKALNSVLCSPQRKYILFLLCYQLYYALLKEKKQVFRLCFFLMQNLCVRWYISWRKTVKSSLKSCQKVINF